MINDVKKVTVKYNDHVAGFPSANLYLFTEKE